MWKIDCRRASARGLREVAEVAEVAQPCFLAYDYPDRRLGDRPAVVLCSVQRRVQQQSATGK